MHFTKAKLASRSSQSLLTSHSSILFSRSFLCIILQYKSTPVQNRPYSVSNSWNEKANKIHSKLRARKGHFQPYFRKWMRVLLHSILRTISCKLEDLISWKWQNIWSAKYNLTTRWCTHRRSLCFHYSHLSYLRGTLRWLIKQTRVFHGMPRWVDQQNNEARYQFTSFSWSVYLKLVRIVI